MKKILYIILAVILLMTIIWFSFIYYVPYSRGTRSGELIKFSNKGVIFKTWEGEISQGISGAQIFSFSILDKDKSVIEKLQSGIKIAMISDAGSGSPKSNAPNTTDQTGTW